MKRAIFGGTFNPIHNGHLHLLQEAQKAAGLDEVILMPTRIPPHKKASMLEKDSVRLEMCRLASAGFDGVSVSDYELLQPEISYTVYTLRHFCGLYPNDEWHFIMGSDMLLSLHTWYRYEEILEMATIIAACREENELNLLREYSRREDMKKLRCILIQADPVVVSSTMIREKLLRGEDCRELIPEAVAEYIRKNKIYRK